MLAFSAANEDDLVTDHSIDCALRIEQYSTWHGTRVVCLGEEAQKLGGGTLMQPRPEGLEMRQ